MNCTKCGNQVNKKDIFCGMCDKQLKHNSAIMHGEGYTQNVIEATIKLIELNKAKRELRQEFIGSAEGQTLIMKYDPMNENGVWDINTDVIRGIEKHPIYRNKGQVTKDMAAGYLMERNGRYRVSGKGQVSEYENKGYMLIAKIDTLAQEADFDNSLDFLYKQAEFINQLTLLQLINEALLNRSEKVTMPVSANDKTGAVKEYNYQTLVLKTQDAREERRKLYEDQESFEIGQQAMKNLREEVIKGIRKTEADKRKKLEDEFKQKLESLSSRKKRIKMIQKHFNVTDAQMEEAKIYESTERGRPKTVNLMPNIQAMENQEFEDYLDELYSNAQREEELFDKREEIKVITWSRNLSRVDSLRESMGFKTLEEMSLKEMDDLIKIMLDAEDDDIFLTQRQLETMKNIAHLNVKTLRDIVTKFTLETVFSIN